MLRLNQSPICHLFGCFSDKVRLLSICSVKQPHFLSQVNDTRVLMSLNALLWLTQTAKQGNPTEELSHIWKQIYQHQMKTKPCHPTNVQRCTKARLLQLKMCDCMPTPSVHASLSLTQHSDTFTCYMFPLQAWKHLVWQNTAGLHLFQIESCGSTATNMAWLAMGKKFFEKVVVSS